MIYYIRMPWMQVAVPVAGTRSLVACFVEVSCSLPPQSAESQQLRQDIALVVREQFEKAQARLTVVQRDQSMEVEEYAHELFETLVERFPTREVRVETPNNLYVHLPEEVQA